MQGIFVCERTSLYGSDESPCEEAYEELYTYTDRRNVDDPMKNPYIGAAWYSKGENHRVENEHICRDFPGRKRWVVKLNKEGDLHDFVLKYGDVVLKNRGDSTPIRLCIEIYDTYRE